MEADMLADLFTRDHGWSGFLIVPGALNASPKMLQRLPLSEFHASECVPYAGSWFRLRIYDQTIDWSFVRVFLHPLERICAF